MPESRTKQKRTPDLSISKMPRKCKAERFQQFGGHGLQLQATEHV